MAGGYLYRRTLPITDKISAVLPTVEEVLADEDNYYSMVSVLTAMPIDLSVQMFVVNKRVT